MGKKGGRNLIIIVAEPNLKLTPEDLDLSMRQQQVLIALKDSPKTSTEIHKKTELTISTVITALQDLKERDLVKSEKMEAQIKVGEKVYTKKLNTDIWQATNKGRVWLLNAIAASQKISRNELMHEVKETAKDLKMTLKKLVYA